MRLVTYCSSAPAGSGRAGALLGEAHVLDLAEAARLRGEGDGAFASLQGLIEAGEAAWDQARALIEGRPDEAVIDLADVRLEAPLPRPVRLRDCSLFLEHMEAAMAKMARTLADAEPEAGREAAYEALMATGRYSLKPIFKEQPVYYNADHLHVVGPGADIEWPARSEWIDYELEWACVVGRPGRDIRREDARAHIFGYTIFNDWSARDIQLPLMETMLGPGEGKDFANGLGPCIATVDEFADPYALTMTARVNGEEWSRGSTGSMFHSFEDAVAAFSRDKMLFAGEVIGSGTVLSGCGFELGRRLAIGDEVELEIEGIGRMKNRVVRR